MEKITADKFEEIPATNRSKILFYYLKIKILNRKK